VLWSRASAARASGRPLPALRLFSAAIAAHPTAGEPYEEAGTLSADVSRGLAEIDRLYETYCGDLNLPRELCPAQILHRRFADDAAMSAVEYLIRAVEIGSGHFGWHMRLAEALERIGQTGVALSYRRRAQRIDPASRTNAVAIGDALAALDGFSAAAGHYQRLAKRWPKDPVFALHLARARLLADPAATEAKCDAALPENFGIKASATFKNAERLLTLARAAAGLDLPAPLQRLLHALVSATGEVAECLPECVAAHLAAGLAALGIGDRRSAARSFALASCLDDQSPRARAPGDETAAALAFARAFLVDPGRARERPAPIDQRLLALACARESSAGGDTFEALRAYGQAIGGFVVRDIPLCYELYKGYKVLANGGKYFGVPARTRDFRIIDGVVCRVPVSVERARLGLPRRLIDLARGLAGLAWRIDRRVLVLLRVRKMIRRIAVKLYLVPGVIVAESREALVELIDLSPSKMTG
jgi:tetratricopeptide (TPR) repeat protein